MTKTKKCAVCECKKATRWLRIDKRIYCCDECYNYLTEKENERQNRINKFECVEGGEL